MRKYSLVTIATNGERFRGFDPYVAAIDSRGRVYFQATTVDGRTGIYSGDGRELDIISESRAQVPLEFCSHPDIDGNGTTCFYARESSGACKAFRHHAGSLLEISRGAGPLGPTMNAAGVIAFRAETTTGAAGIYTARDGHVHTIAQSGERFAAFHGLPVINGPGQVLFRADLTSGTQGIYLAYEDRIATIVETGDRFANLSFFPTINDSGTIAFCATHSNGTSAVVLASGGRVESFIDSISPYESFRGALIDDVGHVIFYATPRGGQLGIYTGPEPHRDLLLGIGSSLFDSTVSDFALNPVSINSQGQLAIRVTLADQRQLIVRADPT